MQAFSHIQTYYIDDLCSKVQDELLTYNKDGYVLVDIKYSGLEKNDGLAHAFLLFTKIPEDE